MATIDTGVLISAGEGKTFPVGNSRITVKVSTDDTQNTYEIVEGTVPPEFDSTAHVHQKMEQAFYILEGEITFQLGERTVRAGAGALVRVPTGTPHAFSNRGKAWGKILQVHTGGSLERMFEELARAFPAGTAIDRNRMNEIMQAYDQTPAASGITADR